MKKRQILGALLFGAMLAMTGCGDDADGTGGNNGGTGGSSGSDFCSTLCDACNQDQVAECDSACEQQLGAIGGFVDLDRCPNELSTLGDCLGNNGCDSDACDSEYTAWITCVASVF